MCADAGEKEKEAVAVTKEEQWCPQEGKRECSGNQRRAMVPARGKPRL
ncbi:hypothetical protein [Alkalihalobacterium sp. APHAB7]